VEEIKPPRSEEGPSLSETAERINTLQAANTIEATATADLI
jgi:hypothetical protein